MLKNMAEELIVGPTLAEQGDGQGHQNVTLQMLNAVQFNSGMTVCDIGCGNGWAVREMLNRGAGLGFGIDISPQMIALAGLWLLLPKSTWFLRHRTFQSSMIQWTLY